jgi:HD-GYP domain-containing protein (c-di-GMP phosphodiesterase class II)
VVILCGFSPHLATIFKNRCYTEKGLELDFKIPDYFDHSVERASRLMSQNIIREKIRVGQLKVGMYVCDLDRPWLETPYPLQGFILQSEDEIQDLMNLCEFVYIDINQEIESEIPSFSQHQEYTFSDSDKHHVHKVKYTDSAPMKKELKAVKAQFEDFSLNTEALVRNLKKGQKLDLSKFRESTKQMVESVVRNPDAVLWLVRLKKSDDYMYQHSLRCSVLAVAFGRQLGLTKRQLNNLAVGAALLDIGKLQLPKSLLNKPGKLSESEFELVRDHVRMSIEMIKESGKDSKEVIDMVASHHERMNGKGYPEKLKGNDIPLFGRIAAIVDCYDAISTTRAYAPAMSPADAVRKLYEWRNVDFHPALVEVFIQALGIYPAGSLVELSTGEVGVVMSEYRTRRLRPTIMLILDQNKHLYDEFPTIDLYETEMTEDGRNINISQSLEPGSYGIDPSALLLG